MSTTNTLARSLSVAQNFLKNTPLTGVGGSPIEPAVTIGDMARQFILQPPFAWRWNRSTTTISASVAGGQDYSKSLSTFGWLEKATYNDGTGGTQSVVELENRLALPEDKAPGPPRYISAWKDDDSGNITFRLLPIPDANYTITINYQNASPVFQNLSDTWSPIPDYMRNIYEYGFRAFAYEYWDDPRFSFTFQMFLRQLVASSEGLNESQKNVVLQQFMDIAKQQQSLTSGQLGRQGRSGY